MSTAKHLQSDQNHRHAKVLMTGGHAATTAIAVIQELKERHKSIEIHWIGSKNAISGSRVTTLEYKIYPKMGVKYHEISAGKLQTKFTRYTIPLLLKFPLGLIQAFLLILKIKPDLVISFGGFASFPVVFWGWVFGIPVILHEQTIAAGRASVLSAFFCRKIALSRSDSLKYFPTKKAIVVGNPIMKEIQTVTLKSKTSHRKNILVVGGSRGSEFINEEIAKIHRKLLQKYTLSHIVGERDYPKYKEYIKDGYNIVDFVDPRDMAKYYSEADIVICRSGANTVSELLQIKRPAILIPLPRTVLDEQTKNAKYVENTGLGIVLTEKEVETGKLPPTIDHVFENWERMVEKSAKFINPDVGAAKRFVNIVSAYL